jgi:soluble lytic murein transglycosylase-like protein
MRYALGLWLAGAAWAGEYAVLASGGQIHIDGHESSGTKVLLHLGAGTIEMDASDLRGFEADRKLKVDNAVPATPSVSSESPAKPFSAVAPDPKQLADQAARKYGLPSSLVRSVMKAESGFQLKAVSPKGAVGLMQLMPSTARSLGANPQDPTQNVDAGAQYLRALLVKYGGGLRRALAAYNAGPAAVERFGGVPPFAETLDYIRRIEQEWKNSR